MTTWSHHFWAVVTRIAWRRSMAQQADPFMVTRKRRKEARIGRRKAKGEGEAGRGEEVRTDIPFKGRPPVTSFSLPGHPSNSHHPPTTDSAVSSSTDDLTAKS